MHLERYPYYANISFFDFDFESEGPKGKIKKIARFTEIGPNVYNFGFGDLDEGSGNINDKIVSNNGDRDKILATVAAIIKDFSARFLGSAIFIKGSTTARTRWYQMNMNAYWEEIHRIFEIFGYKDGKWEFFCKGYNYEAFIGRQRSY